MVLSNLPGIGERLMKRLDDHFGGRHELIKTLESGDISRIAEVEGISIKRALLLPENTTVQRQRFSQPLKLRNCMRNSLLRFRNLRRMLQARRECRC